MKYAFVFCLLFQVVMVLAQDTPPMPKDVSTGVEFDPVPVADMAESPVIARALERRVMSRKVRVNTQFVDDGRVISQMSDGSQVTGKVFRAMTTRLTVSGRDLRDAELAALAARLGVDPSDPRAVAASIRDHITKLDTLEIEATKSKGKAGALGALAGLAIGAAGVAGLKKVRL